MNYWTVYIFSTLGSFVIVICLKYLTNSKKSIEKIFRKEENIIRNKKTIEIDKKEKEIFSLRIAVILRRLKKKILFFIILELLIMVLFSYYISAFCAVYKKTQMSWLTDGFTSFMFSNLIDIIIAFFIASLYSSSIRYKIDILYDLSLFLYDLGH